MIAMSRLADYRHDVYDVTFGSLLGMFMAYFSYRRYYPALRSIDCDTPYPRLSGGYAPVKGRLPGTGDEEQQLYGSSSPVYAHSQFQMQEIGPNQ